MIFVFSLENETSFNAIYNYYAKMSQLRNMQDIPLILVGTQGKREFLHLLLLPVLATSAAITTTTSGNERVTCDLEPARVMALVADL